MLSKAKIKYIQSLDLKKNRDSDKVFIAEGFKIVEEFIVMIYRTPSIAQFCRRMILKTYGDNPELAEIWANAIRRVAREQTVHEDMKSVLWRDYSVLPCDLRDMLTPEVWKYSSSSDFHAIAAAFY